MQYTPAQNKQGSHRDLCSVFWCMMLWVSVSGYVILALLTSQYRKRKEYFKVCATLS